MTTLYVPCDISATKTLAAALCVASDKKISASVRFFVGKKMTPSLHARIESRGRAIAGEIIYENRLAFFGILLDDEEHLRWLFESIEPWASEDFDTRVIASILSEAAILHLIKRTLNGRDSLCRSLTGYDNVRFIGISGTRNLQNKVSLQREFARFMAIENVIRDRSGNARGNALKLPFQAPGYYMFKFSPSANGLSDCVVAKTIKDAQKMRERYYRLASRHLSMNDPKMSYKMRVTLVGLPRSGGTIWIMPASMLNTLSIDKKKVKVS